MPCSLEPVHHRNTGSESDILAATMIEYLLIPTHTYDIILSHFCQVFELVLDRKTA